MIKKLSFWAWPLLLLLGAAAQAQNVKIGGNVKVSGTAGGSTQWSAITDPSTNLSLSPGDFTTTFTWGTSTGATNLFALQDTTGNTGTGYLFRSNSVGTSTLKPFGAFAQGTANGIELTSGAR